MLNYQLRATDALIRFRREHAMTVTDALLHVRDLLADRNSSEACRVARTLKIWGESGLNSTPSPINDEDVTYARVLHESLLRNWMQWLSISVGAKDLIETEGQDRNSDSRDPTPV